MSPARNVKIGIDVGGTFTHAVALDAARMALLGKARVPTTHDAEEGVARGVVQALQAVLAECRIDPGEVALIAHSTTQATNALLEGDVAPVGILGMGRGLDGWLARRQTRFGAMPLAPGRELRTCHRFLDLRAGLGRDRVLALVAELRSEGAEAFVVSEPFGIDRPEREAQVAEWIAESGLPATSAAAISQLYGLRVRTRTAAINASMLPVMLRTADLTERSVRAAGIAAPLMIMRSDGGIMDVAEMRRRPILTMLSGPAAGVAAALMYARISDGVFLEVGGTSTDVSVIQNGRPMIRPAEVGGHRLALQTLDVRTLGVGGGSLPRAAHGRVHDVGPRSAHIARLRYVAFAGAAVGAFTPRRLRPRAGDPDDYLALAADGAAEPGFAFTTTEAALLLGLARDLPGADGASAERAAAALGRELGLAPRQVCEQIQECAAAKVRHCIERMVHDYRLDPELLQLVGGGGGAEAVVPHAAARLGLPHSITAHADVISAIGVALGMIRETIERGVLSPSEADLLQVRAEARAAVIRMGADPVTVSVRVEVDPQRKRLLATAQGTPELRTRELHGSRPDAGALAALAMKALPAGTTRVAAVAEAAPLHVFQGERVQRRAFGLLRRGTRPACVVDHDGVVRLKLAHAEVVALPLAQVAGRLPDLTEASTRYGDAGGLLPDLFVLAAGRVLDLSGLVSLDQAQAVLRAECELL
ncbi:MAG: hydantoinase, partial [Planctomycetes bacterium]|nr:hydantoinase [Planctomycetota bacterium]